MTTDKKKLSIISAVFFGLGALIYLIPGIRGLSLSNTSQLSVTSKKGQLVEFTAAGAKEVYDVHHRLLLIPIGTERYYYLVGADLKCAPMLVKASEKWFKENFNESGLAKNGSVTVKGEVRELRARNSTKVSQFNSTIEGTVSTVSTTLYVNAQYKKASVMGIAAAVLALGYGAAIVLMLRLETLAQAINNKVGGAIFAILGLILVWLLVTLKMIG